MESNTGKADAAANEALYLFDMALKPVDQYGGTSGLDLRYEELNRSDLLAAANVEEQLATHYATMATLEKVAPNALT